jgi:hypothetical protein
MPSKNDETRDALPLADFTRHNPELGRRAAVLGLLD